MSKKKSRDPLQLPPRGRDFYSFDGKSEFQNAEGFYFEHGKHEKDETFSQSSTSYASPFLSCIPCSRKRLCASASLRLKKKKGNRFI